MEPQQFNAENYWLFIHFIVYNLFVLSKHYAIQFSYKNLILKSKTDSRTLKNIIEYFY